MAEPLGVVWEDELEHVGVRWAFVRRPSEGRVLRGSFSNADTALLARASAKSARAQ